jgi:hypothetical protein
LNPGPPEYEAGVTTGGGQGGGSTESAMEGETSTIPVGEQSSTSIMPVTNCSGVLSWPKAICESCMSAWRISGEFTNGILNF